MSAPQGAEECIVKPRERVLCAVDHREPDAIPIDLGGHRSSGISAIAYARLKEHLGIDTGAVYVYDVVQQLAIIEPPVLDRFGVDTIELGRGFALQAADWQDWVLPDGTPCKIPAFIDLVRRQLRRDYQASDLSNEGLRIFTTLAPSDQEFAQRAVSEGLVDLGQRGLPADLQAALVLADVTTGEIRALVGDRVAGRSGFNRALEARRQIGSVIKPLVYLTALEHTGDYNLLTSVVDEPVDAGRGCSTSQ